jgi:membrane protein CcdC involved in cytochrome C biogenesis
MRKVFAVICTLITLFVLKETINIFITDEADIVKQRSIFIVIALSISIPMVILTLWLWKPKNNQEQD